ncbi:TfoX/Sxy family protein [Vibrio sp. Makdt]|uniref:TfoX/Sxy family protein n=1 Tax=Vibrio sp. Makdt TaxID=2998828 RepID=UPI0022CD3D3A|nr:TfoX/Sxy family protein [Vibrio sp. Makdt]MDA0152132.1 TfoX/Sxy family protein [Vibrio sp. Makdt]
MNANILTMALEIKASTGLVHLQSMFGFWGVFYSGTFIGYIDKKTNSLYLKTCRLTIRLDKSGYEMTPLTLKNGLESHVQSAYKIPSETVSTVKSLNETLHEAHEDRLKTELTQEASRCLRIKDLPNMTTKIERKLRDTGITTLNQLDEHGTEKAFTKLLESQTVNSKLILKIEGALTGKHEAVIPLERRLELLAFSQSEIRKQTNLAT